jgi:copper chaperone
MTTRSYTVGGMSCEHCVNAVTAEVGEVPGVRDVAVDLDTGTVTVTGDSIDDEAVQAAVDEAGYSLVG